MNEIFDIECLAGELQEKYASQVVRYAMLSIKFPYLKSYIAVCAK